MSVILVNACSEERTTIVKSYISRFSTVDDISTQAHDVIRNHVEQRRADRLQDPDRFDIKPTIAEQALRRPPPQTTAYDEVPDMRVGTYCPITLLDFSTLKVKSQK